MLLKKRAMMFKKPETKLYLIKDGVVLSDGITLENFSYNSAGFLVTPNSNGGIIRFGRSILTKKYLYFRIKSMQNASNYTFTGQKLNQAGEVVTWGTNWYTIGNVVLHPNVSLPYSKFYNAITQVRFGKNMQTLGSTDSFRVRKTYNVVRVYDAWMSDSTTDYQEE